MGLMSSLIAFCSSLLAFNYENHITSTPKGVNIYRLCQHNGALVRLPISGTHEIPNIEYLLTASTLLLVVVPYLVIFKHYANMKARHKRTSFERPERFLRCRQRRRCLRYRFDFRSQFAALMNFMRCLSDAASFNMNADKWMIAMFISAFYA